MYRDRIEAAHALASKVTQVIQPGALILAIPRGGVGIAKILSELLSVPASLLMVRKIGAPDREELAIGAIAEGDGIYKNGPIIRKLGISGEQFERALQKSKDELHRRLQLYQRPYPLPGCEGRQIFLVDDGLATGATIIAAIDALQRMGAEKIYVAVPVAPPEAIDELLHHGVECICPLVPTQFRSVGCWYEHFDQVSDEEVLEHLAAPCFSGSARK
jgi:putative phosphoribosyl transferase